ncbi:MAG: PHP domain-containing protein [Sedimentisphaerales bacterium]
MNITSDWHIHSASSYDGHIELKDLIKIMPKKGIVNFGVSDHLTTPMQLCDLVNSRKEFDAVKSSSGSLNFRFGIEVSSMSKWEMETMIQKGLGHRDFGIREGGPYDDEAAIFLTKELVNEYDIEYVLGGVHFGLYIPFEREAVIRSYHRQNMFLANNPLVTIIAHPWWFGGHWADSDGKMTTDPWFDDFAGKIPVSMHDEFASAVVQNNKIVEISMTLVLGALYTEKFKHDYLNYLAYLKSKNIKFSIGSDCHGPNYTIDDGSINPAEVNLRKAEELLDSVGIGNEDIWCL